MADQKPSDSTPQDGETVLDALGGGPAVATGTPREQAEQKPAVVQDSASADVPAVAKPVEE